MDVTHAGQFSGLHLPEQAHAAKRPHADHQRCRLTGRDEPGQVDNAMAECIPPCSCSMLSTEVSTSHGGDRCRSGARSVEYRCSTQFLGSSGVHSFSFVLILRWSTVLVRCSCAYLVDVHRCVLAGAVHIPQRSASCVKDCEHVGD